MSEGSITLGDVAEHTTVLAVACRRCDQAGRYNVDTLIARHGEGFGIPNLLRLDPFFWMRITVPGAVARIGAPAGAGRSIPLW